MAQPFAKGCNFSPVPGLSWHHPMNPMKTALISVLTATLLGLASLASGRPFDAAGFLSILFCTGLLALTVAEYSRVPRPLTLERPLRLPVALRARAATLESMAA